MAIYHYSVSVVKRSSGKSAVAGAAYRAAEKIEDLRTGLTHDYTRKTGVDHSEIITPVLAVGENSWLINRSELWNKVEASELRHDSQLARDINIAIPVELDRDKQIALVREYVKTNYVDRGMVADVNFHDLQSNNPHAHIMLTMRDLVVTDGRIEFGNKNRDWNSKDLLIQQRQSWEKLTNQYLNEAGHNIKIDCRTLEEQGIERIPQIHLGANVNAMRKKGIPTDRGDCYDQIDRANADIRSRLEETYQIETEISNLEAQAAAIRKEESTEPELDIFERLRRLPFKAFDIAEPIEPAPKTEDEKSIEWAAEQMGDQAVRPTEYFDQQSGVEIIPITYIDKKLVDTQLQVVKSSTFNSKEDIKEEIKPPKKSESEYSKAKKSLSLEVEETKRLEAMLKKFNYEYFDIRDKAREKLKEYDLTLEADHIVNSREHELTTEFFIIERNHSYWDSTQPLPRAGDLINEDNKIIHKKLSPTRYTGYDLDLYTATNEDKYVEFNRRVEELNSQKTMMKKFINKIDFELKQARGLQIDTNLELIPVGNKKLELQSDNLESTEKNIKEEKVELKQNKSRYLLITRTTLNNLARFYRSTDYRKNNDKAIAEARGYIIQEAKVQHITLLRVENPDLRAPDANELTALVWMEGEDIDNIDAANKLRVIQDIQDEKHELERKKSRDLGISL